MSLAPLLDDPARVSELRALIARKAALRDWYAQAYACFARAVAASSARGAVLELGSGAGFLKELLPEAVTSDALAYEGMDKVVDALALPYGASQLKALLLLNVLHHLPDPEGLFSEAVRCLAPGGVLVIVDQHPGWLGRWLFKLAHHEPFDDQAQSWASPAQGRLGGANGALAWMVFVRDRSRFERLYPELELESYRPCSPLQYWLSGGLKAWTLAPAWSLPLLHLLERSLLSLSPQWGCFVQITLRRRGR